MRPESEQKTRVRRKPRAKGQPAPWRTSKASEAPARSGSEFPDVDRKRKLWEFRFYCWRTTIRLIIASVLASMEGTDAVLSVIHHRVPATVQALIALIRAVRGQ